MLIGKLVDLVTHELRYRDQNLVVFLVFEIKHAVALDSAHRASGDEEGHVVVLVPITLTKLTAMDNDGVVQHRAITFRYGLRSVDQLGKHLHVPGLDLDVVGIRIVRGRSDNSH